MIGVYIGSAIDTANGDVTSPFDRITDLIGKVSGDHVIFNPFTAYRNAHKANHSSAKYLISINYYALDQSDLAVFEVNDSPSFGVPLEIARCAELGKPFIVLYNAKKAPGLYLKDLVLKNGLLINLFDETTEDVVAKMASYVKTKVPKAKA